MFYTVMVVYKIIRHVLIIVYWGYLLDKMFDLCSKTIEKAYYARECAFYKMGLLFPEIMREYIAQGNSF